MNRRARKLLLVGLGIAVSAILLVLSFRNVDLDRAVDEIGEVNPWIFAIVPVIRICNFIVPALRSKILFAPMHPFGLGRLFKSVLLGFAVNNVVPLRAGELARIGYLSRYGDLPLTTTLAVVALERLLDLLGIALIILCTLPLMAIDLPLGTAFYILLAGIMGAMAGAIVVTRRPQTFVTVCRGVAGLFGSRVRAFVGARAETFAEGLASLRSLWSLLAVLGLTLAFWGLAFVSVTCWFWAFGFDLPWYGPVVLLAFLSFGLAVPSTPGNIGTFHFFAISALTTLGVGQTEAASYAVVTHAMATVPFTVLAIPLLFRDYTQSRIVAAEPAAEEGQPE